LSVHSTATNRTLIDHVAIEKFHFFLKVPKLGQLAPIGDDQYTCINCA